VSHSREDLVWLARAAAEGTVPDYQLSAWLMAAYLNPLSADETAWLTEAMAGSGRRLNLEGLPRPWVDKHSTGGVGDKTTIVLLPLLASCGLTIVKMSGRGLGITGGTLDKLASVPGFRLDLSPDEMKEQARRVGLALTGQTPDLAPADKVLYALRDSTSTVDSVPLIVSSILSKKVAGGAETIVLDVKCGSGAFMTDLAQARRLAEALGDAAGRLGLKLLYAITDMSQPLGSAVGNALEVIEAGRVLKGDAPPGTPTSRLKELCVHLAAMTLQAAGTVTDTIEGRMRAERALASGEAYRRAEVWFEAQGASGSALRGEGLPVAPHQAEVRAQATGTVAAVDARCIGQTVLDLGGGRVKKEDSIDPSVGVEVHRTVGTEVIAGDPIATVHAATRESLERALEAVGRGIRISSESSHPASLVLGEG
jgi:pyrimidine-nucleoside phosphorylase